MDVSKILPIVRTKLRIKTTAFDAEDLTLTIQAAIADMKRVGVVVPDVLMPEDPAHALLLQAVVLYCKGDFGNSPKAEIFHECYEDLRDSMALSTDYTVPGKEMA